VAVITPLKISINQSFGCTDPSGDAVTLPRLVALGLVRWKISLFARSLVKEVQVPSDSFRWCFVGQQNYDCKGGTYSLECKLYFGKAYNQPHSN